MAAGGCARVVLKQDSKRRKFRLFSFFSYAARGNIPSMDEAHVRWESGNRPSYEHAGRVSGAAPMISVPDLQSHLGQTCPRQPEVQVSNLNLAPRLFFLTNGGSTALTKLCDKLTYLHIFLTALADFSRPVKALRDAFLDLMEDSLPEVQ